MSFLDDIIDENKAHIHDAQGSDAWDQIRVGRFTSSDLYNLMGHGWRPMNEKELSERPKKGPGSKTTRIPDYTVLSKDADTYIDQKVAEVLTGQPRRQGYAYPLVWGKEQEPFAIELFQETYNLECTRVGFQTFTDHAGGSPDALIGDSEGLEIKSPVNSDNQLDYLRLFHINDIKDNYPQFYWQCVSLLLFTGRERWHFCTFDSRFINPKHRLTHLIFEREKLQSEFDLIVTALENAIERKLQRIESINRITK
jgi:hypothetical protein